MFRLTTLALMLAASTSLNALYAETSPAIEAEPDGVRSVFDWDEIAPSVDFQLDYLHDDSLVDSSWYHIGGRIGLGALTFEPRDSSMMSWDLGLRAFHEASEHDAERSGFALSLRHEYYDGGSSDEGVNEFASDFDWSDRASSDLNMSFEVLLGMVQSDVGGIDEDGLRLGLDVGVGMSWLSLRMSTHWEDLDYGEQDFWFRVGVGRPLLPVQATVGFRFLDLPYKTGKFVTFGIEAAF